jgi:hypothetical protein
MQSRVALFLAFVFATSPAGCSPPGNAALPAPASNTIDRAAPLIAALEAYRKANGRYPQYVDDLVPRYLEAIPDASAPGEPRHVFVYHRAPDSFEIFFLPPAEEGRVMVLYRSTRDYPQRNEPGPWVLTRRSGTWGVYRLLPSRKAVVVKQWRGTLPIDRAPMRVSHVTDAVTLGKLWKSWEVAYPLPNVDFSRQIVLAAMARSGLVMFMGPVIDADGDLKKNVVATPDAPNYWSWAISVVERDGVVSVDGKPLPPPAAGSGAN